MMLSCPCCGSPNPSGADFNICEKCNWEHDLMARLDPDEVDGGPNGDYTLNEARDNFKKYGTMYRSADQKT